MWFTFDGIMWKILGDIVFVFIKLELHTNLERNLWKTLGLQINCNSIEIYQILQIKMHIRNAFS